MRGERGRELAGVPDNDTLVDALGEERAVGVLCDGVDVRGLLEDVPVL
jgi:hypothetical protein